MSFEIDEVGDKIKSAFSGKKGKVLLIGGGVLLAGAVLLMNRKKAASGEVVLSSYPTAPTADQSADSTTVYDQMSTLTDTFTESLANMNTGFTDALNAQNESLQGQLDDIRESMNVTTSSYADGLNTLTDTLQGELGDVRQSVADVSSNLIDFANKQAEKNASYSPGPDITSPGYVTPPSQQAISANQQLYLKNTAAGISPTGGKVSSGNQAWAQAELDKAKAANQKTYLQNLANGKKADGSKARAGDQAWAKAQLKKG